MDTEQMLNTYSLLRQTMANSVCRVCLVGNIRLLNIHNIRLINVYEKLTNVKLNTETGNRMPSSICYICHGLLQRCHRFSDMARKSNRVLLDLLYNTDEETHTMLTTFTLENTHKLAMNPTQHWSINTYSNTTSTTPGVVKEEQVDVKDKVKSETEEIVHEALTFKIQQKDLENYDDSNNSDPLQDNDNYVKIDLNDVPITSYSDDCHKKKNTDYDLKLHTRGKIYSCSKSPKNFLYKRIAIAHIQSHTKPYACNICNRSYCTKSNLNKHIRIHTGLKPYKCNTCVKSYSTKSNLNKHIRIHTGLKPYKCNTCVKSYSTKSNLNLHMRIHGGEKPYTCIGCNKAFAGPEDLNSHMQTECDDSNNTEPVASSDNNVKNNLNDDHKRKNTTECELVKHLKLPSGEKEINLHNQNIPSRSAPNPAVDAGQNIYEDNSFSERNIVDISLLVKEEPDSLTEMTKLDPLEYDLQNDYNNLTLSNNNKLISPEQSGNQLITDSEGMDHQTVGKLLPTMSPSEIMSLPPNPAYRAVTEPLWSNPNLKNKPSSESKKERNAKQYPNYIKDFSSIFDSDTLEPTLDYSKSDEKTNTNKNKLKKSNKNKNYIKEPVHKIEHNVLGDNGMKQQLKIQKKERLRLKQCGQAYTRRDGTEIPAKQIKPNPCTGKKCGNGCGSVSNEKRKSIFDYFWSLSTAQRKDWLVYRAQKTAIKRKRSKDSNKRSCNYKLSIADGEGKRQVCLQFLAATLDVSIKHIQYIVQNSVTGTI